MAKTMQNAMDDARGVLQDRDATNYRWVDADLLSYGNQAVAEIALRRPDLFATFTQIPLTNVDTYQVAPAGTLRLMDIIRVTGGRVVKECSQDDLDQYNVNWHADAAGPTKNWVRHPRSPLAFYVSPPSDGTIVLTGMLALTPVQMVATDQFTFSDAYFPIVCDYIIWKAESRDDEAVQSARATLFLAAFNGSLGVSARTKATADSDVGNKDTQTALAASAQQGASPGYPPAAQQPSAAY
jgi:hypothetical protein